MATDLETAILALQLKKPYYDAYWRYYDGEPALIYNTKRLAEVFKHVDASFRQNWCAVVVNSVLDRMELRTPTVSSGSADADRLALMWEEVGMAEDEYSVHEDVAVTGEAFVIAWEDERGAMQAFYNDARLCHVFYEPSNPRRKRFAAKWWQETDETLRLTLYYPDRFEYYRTLQKALVADILQASAFVPMDEPVATNDRGVIPVFHFRSTTRRPRSQLQDVTETQDAINKLLADMMVAAEFGAFRQRWAITNADLTGVKARPDTIIRIPPADGMEQPVTIGEFSTTDLANYLASITQLSTSIGIVTRTPKHYFYAQGGDPSGEALIALEAPLTRKVERLQSTLRPVWRELAAYLLGITDTSGITVEYEDVETVQPLTEAQITLTLKQAGLPLASALKERGWDEDDIDEVVRDTEAIPLTPVEMKAQREALVMDQQLGASKQTILESLGYRWDTEQRQVEEEGVNAGDQLLTAFDRGANAEPIRNGNGAAPQGPPPTGA